jgi:hypothetical protein
VSRAAIAAAGLSLAVMGASLWISRYVFETIPHVEDEFANLWQAKVMASGRIALPSPLEAESFVPFVDYHGCDWGLTRLAAALRRRRPLPVLGQSAPGGDRGLVDLSTGVGGRGLAGVLAALLAASSPMLLMLSVADAARIEHRSDPGGCWRGSICCARKAAQPAPGAVVVAAAGLAWAFWCSTPVDSAGFALPFCAVILIVKTAGSRSGLRLPDGRVAAVLPAWQWALTGNPGSICIRCGGVRPYRSHRCGVLAEIPPRQAWINTQPVYLRGSTTCLGDHTCQSFPPSVCGACRKVRPGLSGRLPTGSGLRLTGRS